ncbi:MAG: anaerobic glycerol-3-phosphate dehydrogenase subunit C [Caldilineaceae bacterium]
MHGTSWQSVDHSLDACIKCNICTSYCPVAAVTDLFPGPKYAGPQAQRFRENDQPHSPDHSVDYCSGCRVCNEVCPTGVRIAELNARARAQIAQEKGIPVRNRLLGRNELMGKVGSYVAPLANFGLHNPVSRILAEQVMGIARDAPLPHWSTDGTFGQWMKRTASERLKSDKRVVYYHGCATMYYEPYVGKAAVAVLEHCGYEVIVPPQNCCGLPMLSNGEFTAAAKYHRNNVAHLAGFAQAGIPIVGTSTSCTLTLQEEAPELLDMHDEGAMALKMGTWDIFEWLRELHEAGELPTNFNNIDLTVPYHAPCQMRAHRVGKPALEILSLIPDLRLPESHAACCGIAGTYGYKKEKYDIGMAVGADLFDFVLSQSSEVRYSACDSETCRWQMDHGTGIPSRHPIEFLAMAYGLYDIETRTLIP